MRAVFFCAAFGFACAYGAPLCPGPTTQKCIYGTAFKKIPAVSATACCQACVNENKRSTGVGGSPACAGWQYGSTCKYCSAATPCVLKSDIPGTYTDNCTSAVLSPAPHPSLWTLQGTLSLSWT